MHDLAQDLQLSNDFGLLEAAVSSTDEFIAVPPLDALVLLDVLELPQVRSWCLIRCY